MTKPHLPMYVDLSPSAWERPVGIRYVVVEASLLNRLVEQDSGRDAIARRVTETLERAKGEWPTATLVVPVGAETEVARQTTRLLPALRRAKWIDACGLFGLAAVKAITKRSQLEVFGAVAAATDNGHLTDVVRRSALKEAPSIDASKSDLETLMEAGAKVLTLAVRDFHVDSFATPGPNIVCAGFPKLHATVGCPFRCSFCYLVADEAMFRAPAFTRAFVNIDDAVTAMRTFEKRLAGTTSRKRINMGELTDTLAIEPVLQLLPPLFEALVDLPHLELALVSKSAHPCPVVPEDARGRVFDYRSVSCEHAFEGKTADPVSRIDALAISRKNGAVTCVRLDPLGPAVLRSLDDLSQLQPYIERILVVAQPALVVLGTPRFADRLLHVHHRGVQNYIARVERAVGGNVAEWDRTDSKLRPDEGLRVEAYNAVRDLIRSEAARLSVAPPRVWPCKEAPDVLRALGLSPSGCCYDAQRMELP